METPASLDIRQGSQAKPLIEQLDRAAAAVEASVEAGSPLRTKLQVLRERLKERRLQLAVLGQFKRGKSTFVNALVGVPILPTAVVPLTAIPTFIAWGEEPLISVQFTDGQPPQRFTANEPSAIREILCRFVTEDANPRNQLRVERVDVCYPAAILAEGLVLIDTPGIGSTLLHNTEAALRVIPECDASFVIVSADPPITEAELAYLRRVKSKIGRTVFVLNKVDYLSPDDQRAALDFLRRILTDEFLIDPNAPVFPVSARLALSAEQAGDHETLRQSGMADLRSYLDGYLASQKMQLLNDAIRRKAVDIVSLAITDVQLRERTLKMPLEQLEQKSVEFARTLRSIEVQRLTIGDLLVGDRRRLIDDLEMGIGGLRGVTLFQLTQVIDECISSDEKDWESAVKVAVPVKIEELFSNAADEFVYGFSKEASELLSEHGRRVDALISEIRRIAAEMFDVTFAAERELETFRLRQEPYWVTERTVSTLIPNYDRALDRLFSSAARRRRRRARVIEQTNEMIIRNAENLRWAIRRGLDETFRVALADFEERLSDAIGATKGIIESTLERRRDQSFANELTLDRLEGSMSALLMVRKALSG